MRKITLNTKKVGGFIDEIGGLLCRFPGFQQSVCAVGKGGRKEENVAAVAYLQFFSHGVCSRREVPDGYVGLAYGVAQLLDVVFLPTELCFYLEYTPAKVGVQGIGCV